MRHIQKGDKRSKNMDDENEEDICRLDRRFSLIPVVNQHNISLLPLEGDCHVIHYFYVVQSILR